MKRGEQIDLNIPKLERESLEARQRRLIMFYERGKRVALGYRLGDKYLGAWGEADKDNIRHPESRAWFVEGFLANVPKPIVTNEDGYIIRIEGTSSRK